MFKFALRDFSGNPVSYWIGTHVDIPQVKSEVKAPGHHILVIDRSGSMYYDIADLRAKIEKVLTLDEFRQPNLKISLISYSGKGDLTLHFAKVLVEDVMKTGSKYLEQIRAIRSTGMTCISQALSMAETLIDNAETTCISLHSDGYANDASPTSEQRAIAETMQKLRSHTSVFVNTVAYSRNCDFNLLSMIANDMSGTCIQATSINDVYTALYDATALLSSPLRAIDIPVEGADYVTFYSGSQYKVLGSAQGLAVRGIRPEDEARAWRYKQVTEDMYYDSDADEDDDVTPLLVFARALLSEGKLNQAKYAIVESRIADLLTKHYKALVPSAVADFAADLDHALFSEDAVFDSLDAPGLPSRGPSLLSVFSTISAHTDGFLVHMPSVWAGYKRRSVKRIEGTRNADGTITEPPVTLEPEDVGEWQSPTNFVVNNSEATINMLVSTPAHLLNRATKARIASVAGVPLSNLRSHRNVTLVSDGDVVTPKLTFRITNKVLHGKLKDIGLDLGAYDHTKEHVLNLADMPVVDFNASFNSFNIGTLNSLVEHTVLKSIFSALKKAAATEGEGTPYSKEQIAELAAHCLTPALNWSPTTTTEYADLAKAIADGVVDYRTSYQVVVGSTKLLHLKDLYSANEYLQRRFTLQVPKAGGGYETVAKPTFDYFYTQGVVWGIKELSARTKLNAIDDVMFPIFKDILGKQYKHSDATVQEAYKNPESVASGLAAVDGIIEGIMATAVRPLAFYIGATGLVPEQLQASMKTAEEMQTAYGLSPGKAEKEATFFVLPDGTTLLVYQEAKLYSVSKKA
jgi:Mg-chelatase subunit ChlD